MHILAASESPGAREEPLVHGMGPNAGRKHEFVFDIHTRQKKETFDMLN